LIWFDSSEMKVSSAYKCSRHFGFYKLHYEEKRNCLYKGSLKNESWKVISGEEKGINTIDETK